MSRVENKASASAFALGLLFAVGLALAGMTSPAKVIAFLDLAGDWDPSLAFVMAGAIATHAIASRFILTRKAPVLAEKFDLPEKKSVDARLVTGAALFGVGWGLGGYCPGPALVTAAAGVPSAIVFVLAMAAGMFLESVARGQKSPAAPRLPA